MVQYLSDFFYHLFIMFVFFQGSGHQANVSGFLHYFFLYRFIPDSKVHGANTGPIWVLSAPDGPHVGPINLAIRVHWQLPELLRGVIHHIWYKGFRGVNVGPFTGLYGSGPFLIMTYWVFISHLLAKDINNIFSVVAGGLTPFPQPIAPVISATSPVSSSPYLGRLPHHNLSMYRTPSGMFYCHACNITLQSEVHFAQHLDSKRHKMNHVPSTKKTNRESLCNGSLESWCCDRNTMGMIDCGTG